MHQTFTTTSSGSGERHAGTVLPDAITIGVSAAHPVPGSGFSEGVAIHAAKGGAWIVRSAAGSRRQRYFFEVTRIFPKNRGALRFACLCAIGFPLLAGAAPEQRMPESRNMALLAHHDLQGRSAYQPVIHEQHGRWIAYIGHHSGSQPNRLTGRTEANGTSIIDVTDPRQPRYLHHIPGDAVPGRGSGGAQMVRVCGGRELPRGDSDKVYLLRSAGNNRHELWDVAAPGKPVFLATVSDRLDGTHKNWWECDTGIAYLVSGVPGWRTHRMTQVFDLADPARPVFIRNFGLLGQEPGASGPVPTGLHGPISTGPRGNRVYFGHGTSSGGILQIVDRAKLLKGPPQPTPENLLHPQVGRFDLPADFGAHTVFPLIGMSVKRGPNGGASGIRNFVVVTNEALSDGCTGPRQRVWIIDVTDESRPVEVAQWTVDEAIGNYCARPGRVGSHSSHESFTPIYYGRVMFIAHFNAGVRAVDIRDPYQPREIAYFVPSADAGVAVATNNVEVDSRGYIYIVDRGRLGLHILKLTGQARAVANFR